MKSSALDRERRYELARVSFVEAVERALRNENVTDERMLFAYVAGALGVADEKSNEWKRTLEARRCVVEVRHG